MFRPRIRRLLRVASGLAALLILALLGGVAYEQRARSRAAADHPPPGRLVTVGDRTLHLDCRGTGSPTVLFEAGLDANGSLAWSAVHDSVAATTRACAYDRAGIMWSGPLQAGEVRDAAAVARDLGRLLDAAAEPGPFVVVGHSLGGPYALVFTAARPANVAGLVLVDASHPEQEARLRPAVGDLTGKMASQMGVARVLAASGGMRLFLQPDTAQFPGFPPPQLAVAGRFQPQGMPAVMAEAAALGASMEQARVTTAVGDRPLGDRPLGDRPLGDRPLGDRPLVVLTALRPLGANELAQMQISERQGAAMRAIWDTLHVEEAAWSTRGRHVRVPDSGHYLQFDRPDLVIGAVREVVGHVRGGAAAPATAGGSPD
jgi:pimeloyl-ACP methyl ester carboxylesterase